MPSIFVPFHDQAVTTLENTAITINNRDDNNVPHRICNMMAVHKTIKIAPFSFGSQPQNRPQDWSAQIPPKTVPNKLKK